ncbi:MAG: asparagine synthase (glutamine-hydrolyzing), partial [Crenarchaeota archaeon]|nr:asparagine synthase (glutamine-hydrolyzing) [Thermoproteota archaeon]
MCGICGIISKTSLTFDHAQQVNLMNQALIHRGPDDTGIYVADNFAFAMRRLSIIDVNSGNQPLYNEDGSIVLVANGEIYNYCELIESLKIRNHHFNTKSDCETILHLYEEYGENCVHYLRGMFAFALWDSKKNKILLVRDRMGEKPLYIYENNDIIIFSSEMKSLLNSGLIPFDINPTAVDLFFHYLYIPEPKTAIKNVRKLPAGNIFCIDLLTWKQKEIRYWSIESAPPLFGNPVEIIRDELDSVSDLIIRSDVPVGIALSGGLDSSAIAALTTEKYPEKMHGFSIGYSGRPFCDEREDAQKFADYLDIYFHDVELKTDNLVSLFPDLIAYSDDPISDISSYGYYSVAKLAHENGISVILQGHGSDELFWGYPWVKEAVFETNRKRQLLKGKWATLFQYLSINKPDNYSLNTLAYWM